MPFAPANGEAAGGSNDPQPGADLRHQLAEHAYPSAVVHLVDGTSRNWHRIAAPSMVLPTCSQEPDLDGARGLLGELCGRLRSGLQMPNTAQRLINTFENDCRIEDTLAVAAALARDSLALKAERARAAFIRNIDGRG